jgi:signal transduction histidine kinase
MARSEASGLRGVPEAGNDRTVGAAHDMPAAMHALLTDSECVSFARFARDGSLQDANPRFIEVCAAGLARADIRLPEIVAAGQRDEMLRLLEGGAPDAERRNVHFGSGVAVPVSLRVTWARDGDDLLMLGESPVSDVEATQLMLVRLNGRVSELARENAKKSADLERALAELQQAQMMLVHREKMAALGRMTAGVAHELNNPLAYIRNNVYLLRQGVDALVDLANIVGENLDAIEVAQPGLFEKLMEQIEVTDLPRVGGQAPTLVNSIDEGVNRAVELVAELRTFSRLDEATVKTVDLNESLHSVVEFIGLQVKEAEASLSVDWGTVPPLTCQPGSLNQAVLNLLSNAIQANSPGGRVGLATLVEGDEALIRVTDDGPGVPDDIVQRIFDPFFTTRPVGQGTGLGLSIAHTLVSAQNGHISVGRSAICGAEFTIHLPLDREGDA